MLQDGGGYLEVPGYPIQTKPGYPIQTKPGYPIQTKLAEKRKLIEEIAHNDVKKVSFFLLHTFFLFFFLNHINSGIINTMLFSEGEFVLKTLPLASFLFKRSYKHFYIPLKYQNIFNTVFSMQSSIFGTFL